MDFYENNQLSEKIFRKNTLELLEKEVKKHFKKKYGNHVTEGSTQLPFFEKKAKFFKDNYLFMRNQLSSFEDDDDGYTCGLPMVLNIEDRGKISEPDYFLSVLDEILTEDYRICIRSECYVSDQLWCITVVYHYWAQCNWIPPEVFHKLDFAAFQWLPFVGFFGEKLPEITKAVKFKRRIKEGKRQQKKRTADVILDAYNSLGAQWIDDGSKKPIIVKGEKMAINKLAGEIFIHLQGVTTQRHINNYLKELHEKGEI